VGHQVISAGAVAGKALSADGARVLLCVSFHVQLQVRRLHKRLRAQAALPRPLAEVCHLLVPNQLLPGVEPLRALVTDVVVLVRVPVPHVRAQCLRTPEHLVARRADLRLPVGVVHQTRVHLEVGRLLERPAALRAQMRTEVRVRALVEVAVRRLAEPTGAAGRPTRKRPLSSMGEHVSFQRLSKFELATAHVTDLGLLLPRRRRRSIFYSSIRRGTFFPLPAFRRLSLWQLGSVVAGLEYSVLQYFVPSHAELRAKLSSTHVAWYFLDAGRIATG